MVVAGLGLVVVGNAVGDQSPTKSRTSSRRCCCGGRGSMRQGTARSSAVSDRPRRVCAARRVLSLLAAVVETGLSEMTNWMLRCPRKLLASRTLWRVQWGSMRQFSAWCLDFFRGGQGVFSSRLCQSFPFCPCPKNCLFRDYHHREFPPPRRRQCQIRNYFWA